jgi:site-specific DNA-methyltransferase (adenine-specific)
MGYHYRARYEFVLFFEKGKRRLNNLGVADIISVPRVHRGYPAEKPPEVSEILIQQSTAAGETVADPFMGSGSVGVAALRSGRRFIGTDVNIEAVRMTAKRLREFGAGQEPAELSAEPAFELVPLSLRS